MSSDSGADAAQNKGDEAVAAQQGAARESDPGSESGERAVAEGGADAAEPSRSKSLFGPLIAIPALIVFTIVLIFVLFGQIAGSEPSLAKNLETVRTGGVNERTQALLGLVLQLEENLNAREAGKELPWPVEDELVADLERAWDELPEDDLSIRYVLAMALFQAGADDQLEKLRTCLTAPDDFDPTGRIRHPTLATFGMAAPSLSAERQAQLLPEITVFFDHPDVGLQLAAAIALQSFSNPDANAALVGTLARAPLELRGQAAISLSHIAARDDLDTASRDRAAAVLWELFDRDSYDRERVLEPEKWTREANIVETRAKAVEALLRLGRGADIERLQAAAQDDASIEVRSRALKALESAGLLE